MTSKKLMVGKVQITQQFWRNKMTDETLDELFGINYQLEQLAPDNDFWQWLDVQELKKYDYTIFCNAIIRKHEQD